MAVVQGMQLENPVQYEDIMAELSGYGLIEVTGDDALSFLSGLSTSDVKLVSPSYSQFSAICDTKGRVLASFLIFKRYDAYYLFLPADMVEPVIRKLKLHVLRAKVSINDHGENLKLMGLSGTGTTQLLSQALAMPIQEDSFGITSQSGDCTVIPLPGETQPRWLVVGSNDAMDVLCEKLLPDVALIDKDEWAYLDAISGVPFIVPATAGEYLPQMLNLESLGGLSFTKGCYPGQEVIARLHYRGKLKRKLYIAHTDSQPLPDAGTPLYHADNPNCIGHVLSAARHSTGQVALQAVIEIEQQSQGEVILASPTGSRLIFTA
ncbi:tRNA-modifying protein YgfZ [Methyloglobulus morosus KoM1]|uniref:tRNA-modifying protein YgfZ n=1 Tax=Methyloglobulus morosus KoM1 TaxID=1116472 RepID=V5C9R7_9GAMM|nr:folate-binding protein YgfZ [Methyloglobulus morosus]ESS73533.1 tRNA-modifying protein YgfZ [Methyloglobulus morosus KoM1]